MCVVGSCLGKSRCPASPAKSGLGCTVFTSSAWMGIPSNVLALHVRRFIQVFLLSILPFIFLILVRGASHTGFPVQYGTTNKNKEYIPPETFFLNLYSAFKGPSTMHKQSTHTNMIHDQMERFPWHHFMRTINACTCPMH